MGVRELREQQKTQRQLAEWGGPSQVGQMIVSEVVKISGAQYDRKTGDWSWSLENIGKYFQEEPIWATVDALTLGVPVAKWGLAVGRVARGSTAIGRGYKAYKAGKVGGEAARVLEAGAQTRGGRVIEALTSPQFARATELARDVAPQSKLSRGVFSRITSVAPSDEFVAVAREGGDDIWEQRRWLDVLEREVRLASGGNRRMRQELHALTADFTEDQRRLFDEYLEAGTNAADPAVLVALGRHGAMAYQRTVKWRDALHDELLRLGWIDEETHTAMKGVYRPHLYEEIVRAQKEARAVSGEVAGASKLSLSKAAREGMNRLKHRSNGEVDLTLLYDANATIEELGKVTELIAYGRMGEKLRGSALANDAGGMLDFFSRLADAPPGKVHEMHPGFTDDVAEAFRAIRTRMHDGEEIGLDEMDELFEKIGWQRLANRYEGKELPKKLWHLKPLEDLYLAPGVVDDIHNMTKLQLGALTGELGKIYWTTMGLFRAGKTAYNPATGARNYFSNIIFNSLTTGRLELTPTQGLKAMFGKTDEFWEMVESGMLSTSFTDETLEVMKRAFPEKDWSKINTSAIDFTETIPGFRGRFGKALRKGGAQAEHVYRWTDDVWKMNSYIHSKRKALKMGMSHEDAVAHATLEVARYMPTYALASPVAETIRAAVPFSSFTFEAARTWKNAMTYKPHWVLFWNHFADTVSIPFAMAAGMGPEQLDEMRSLLPDYQQNKLSVVLPFRVGGKPQALDLSYIVPMGSIGDLKGEEQPWSVIINPATHPFFSIAAATFAGKDIFTGREAAPEFTERFISPHVPGVQRALDYPIGEGGFSARRVVGIAEHAMRTLLPPMVPPGYAGNNLLELVTQKRSGYTGKKLEENAFKTIASNVLGLKTYEASLESSVRNARYSNEGRRKLRSQAWNRYGEAAANGNRAAMKRALADVRYQTEQMGDDADDYIEKNIDKHAPGAYPGLSKKQLREAIGKAQRTGRLNAEDRKKLGELYRRLDGKQKRGRKRRSRRRRS